MRKIYTYRIIRYFPFPRSDEFFNVGIIVQDKQGNTKSIYINEHEQHIKYLCQFPSINKRALPFFLEKIKQEKDANFWYDNHLRFSEVDMMICEQSIDEVASMLYEDYIGYKFHTKDLKDRYELARENTKIVFEKKFKSKLILSEFSEYSFSIINKRKEKKYFGRFGSVGDKNDIKEIIYFSLNDDHHKKMDINFLGIISADDERIAFCQKTFFTPNHIDYFSYLTKEDSEKYLERLSA